jgi:flagellar biosynthetic protein FlhB
MAERPSGEKTEAPTPKKFEDAAKNGDLFQSRELVTAMGVLAGVLWLWLAGPWLHISLASQLADGLTLSRADLDGFDPMNRIMRLLMPIALPLGLLTALTIAAAIAAPAITGALGWRSGNLAVKGSRLNPVSGLKRMFGMQGLIELSRSLIKTVFLLVLVLWWLDRNSLAFAGLAAPGPVPDHMLGQLLLDGVILIGAGFVVIALIDVPVQRWRRIARLMMTLQEVKDEHKQSEGAPEKKAAIRRRQQAILSQSMRKGIREAQVVVTNPEHFAIALRYRQGEDAAPVIMARGADELAAAIRSFAADHGVPVLSAPPLARAIYFTGQVGQMIDARLYMAVAALLAFLFRLDRAVAAGDILPELPIPPDLRFDSEGQAMG